MEKSAAPNAPEPQPQWKEYIKLLEVEQREAETPIENEGLRVGSFRYTVCHSSDELSKCINFRHLPGGFSQYEQQMIGATLWPMAFFHWLEVYTPYLRQGFGRKGMRMFREAASRAGARCGFLRIGWGDLGDDDSCPLWRQNFYSEEGWILLKNPIPEFTVPIMYLPLDL
jgi:hypothetical protein